MARLLLILAALLLLLFGLGYLGAPQKNSSFIVFAAILFFLGLRSGRYLPHKNKTDASEFSLERLSGLMNEGRKIEAIRYYREATGASLKDAKAYLEDLDSSMASASPSSLPLDQDLDDAIRTIKEKSKIEAIREVRKLTGLSLREAKEYVDAL